MSLAAGSTFGSYKIVEPLGKGGMATVYKAYEAALDRYVALKVLPGEFLHDETFGERFKREARFIARLEHPNIIPIHAFGIENGVPWMAMRLIPGGALAGMLKGKRLEAGRVVAILRGAAEALDYANSKSVVHRDVKPQNILLDEAERVYLADFGIAKLLEGSQGLTATGMINGTPQYMAPEQATGQPVDHRADIYALGVVAYEMLTGRVPFTADTPVAVLMKQVSEPVPTPSPAEVPEPLARALVKALAKNPDERYASAVAFVKGLEQGLVELPTVTGPSVPTVLAQAAIGSTLPSRPVVRTMVGSRAYPPPPSGHDAAPPPPSDLYPQASTSGGGKGLIIGLAVGAGLFVMAGAALLVVLVTRPSAATAERRLVTPPPPTTIAGIPIESAPPPGQDGGPAFPVPTAPAYPSPEPIPRTATPPPTQNLPPPTWPAPDVPLVRLRPDSHPFTPESTIPIDLQSGPVRVPTARFTTIDKGPGKVDLRTTFPVMECPGGDWELFFTVELLDDEGRLLNSFQHHTGCEDESKSKSFNKGMLKALVGAARGVRVRLRVERD